MQWLSTSPAAGSPGNLNGSKAAERASLFANAEQVLQVIRERAVDVPHHSVVLSIEMCDDLDATLTEALAKFSSRLQQLILARVKDHIREALARAGLLGANVHEAATTVYRSRDDAVQATKLCKTQNQ